jgi:hypothetical protein
MMLEAAMKEKFQLDKEMGQLTSIDKSIFLRPTTHPMPTSVSPT